MKRIVILLAAIATMAIVAPASTYAQDNILNKNDIMVQATIGLPISFSIGSCVVPPVSATIEYGVADFGRFGSLGVGGTFEYARNKHLDYITDSYANNNIVLEALACYHYSFTPRFAVHAKVGVGYWNGLGVGANWSRSARAGVTYLFNDHLGVIAEAGYSYVSSLRVGIALRF